MQKFNKIIFGLVCLVLFFSVSTKASAAVELDCECYSDLDKLGAAQVFKNQKTILQAICVSAPNNTCKDKVKTLGKDKLAPVCFYIESKTSSSNAERCKEFVQEWNMQYKNMIVEGKKVTGSSAVETSAGASALSDLIQKCGLPNMPSECWDITIFISLLLQLVNYLFGIIGALALGAFVYGGFVLILSQGNPEKVKQGTGAMINAVIGLLVAFSGYVLVSFLGQVLGLGEAFSLLK